MGCAKNIKKYGLAVYSTGTSKSIDSETASIP
jgi:hypothetical protein